MSYCHFLRAGLRRGALLLATAICGTVLSAQTVSVFDDTSPVGLLPSGRSNSYPISGFEQYNTFSGVMTSVIPLRHIGGRGEAGFDIVLNLGQVWQAAKRFGGSDFFIPIETYPNTSEGEVDGMVGSGAVFSRTGSVFIPCISNPPAPGTTIAKVVLWMPSGAQIEFVDQNTNGAPYTNPNACTAYGQSVDAGRGTIFKSTDGGSITFVSDTKILDVPNAGFGESDTAVSGYVYFPNGTTYRIDKSNVTWIRDRNGNKISFTYGTYGSTLVWATWYLLGICADLHHRSTWPDYYV